jgi:putative endonuclease
MFYCYLLYSLRLNRFYIGSTTLPVTERFENHLTKFYGNDAFTAKTTDWEIFLSIECASYHQAKLLETHIKKMKSSAYNRNLKKFPEMIEKLLMKFPGE